MKLRLLAILFAAAAMFTASAQTDDGATATAGNDAVAAKVETAEAKSETAAAKQETAEAKSETAAAKQETAAAMAEAAKAKAELDAARLKAEADLEAARQNLAKVQRDAEAARKAAAEKAHRERIAVVDVVAKGGVNKTDVESIPDMIEVFLGDQYEVITRNNLAHMLTEQGFQQSSGMVDSSEARATLGNVLGVDNILVPTVSQVGSKKFLTMAIINTTTGKVVNSSSRLSVRDFDELAYQLPAELRKMGVGKPLELNMTVGVTKPSVGESVQPQFWDLFSDDFVARMQDCLIENGVDVVERIDQAGINKETGFDNHEEAGYLIVTTISRLEYAKGEAKEGISGTIPGREVFYIQGKVAIQRVRDKKIVATIPFEGRMAKTDVDANTRRDWQPRDFFNYLTRATLNSIAPKLVQALEKESSAAK
ncbi:MAG: hypothetical protein VB042_08215 [Victivallaceae bacterium]|nr:hypothetical protein [Victivallaceae bacterium]